jgi:hypothetical protein
VQEKRSFSELLQNIDFKIFLQENPLKKSKQGCPISFKLFGLHMKQSIVENHSLILIKSSKAFYVKRLQGFNNFCQNMNFLFIFIECIHYVTKPEELVLKIDFDFQTYILKGFEWGRWKFCDFV